LQKPITRHGQITFSLHRSPVIKVDADVPCVSSDSASDILRRHSTQRKEISRLLQCDQNLLHPLYAQFLLSIISISFISQDQLLFAHDYTRKVEWEQHIM